MSIEVNFDGIKRIIKTISRMFSSITSDRTEVLLILLIVTLIIGFILVVISCAHTRKLSEKPTNFAIAATTVISSGMVLTIVFIISCLI